MAPCRRRRKMRGSGGRRGRWLPRRDAAILQGRTCDGRRGALTPRRVRPSGQARRRRVQIGSSPGLRWLNAFIIHRKPHIFVRFPFSCSVSGKDVGAGLLLCVRTPPVTWTAPGPQVPLSAPHIFRTVHSGIWPADARPSSSQPGLARPHSRSSRPGRPVLPETSQRRHWP